MEQVAYRGWPNCCRLSNPAVEVVATTDVGPRIIRFGFAGGENEFKEYDSMSGSTGGIEWRIYGGHRLWHAPESRPRTYCPDNGPVRFEPLDDGVRLIQAVEPTTGIQKEIDVRLTAVGAQAIITHRLRNTTLWTVALAPWALSVMAPGGKAIIPLPARGAHESNLAPTSALVLWPYTDLTDRRWTLGRDYVMLQQDPTVASPQKIGVVCPNGWAAYARNGHLFVKKFQYQPRASYPDFGASVETFTNADMLEVETLGPMARLGPGEVIEHVEEWFLFRDVPTPVTDNDIERTILPLTSRSEATT